MSRTPMATNLLRYAADSQNHKTNPLQFQPAVAASRIQLNT